MATSLPHPYPFLVERGAKRLPGAFGLLGAERDAARQRPAVQKEIAE